MYNFKINIQNRKNCNQITRKLNKNSIKSPPAPSPLSATKQLLAHLKHHLLPDNKLLDHRHTHTDRVSYAHTHK